MRLADDASDLDAARGQLEYEEDVVACEAREGENL
jgi:hypothetical protein